MARPLRISFSGACYHVTARGNARQRIYHDDRDREAFLARLEAVVLTQVSRQAGMRREEIERPTPGRVSVARLAAVQVAWERCGVTQREIGAACGVTPFAVSKLIRRADALRATDRKFRKLIDSTSTALQT